MNMPSSLDSNSSPINNDHQNRYMEQYIILNDEIKNSLSSYYNHHADGTPVGSNTAKEIENYNSDASQIISLIKLTESNAQNKIIIESGFYYNISGGLIFCRSMEYIYGTNGNITQTVTRIFDTEGRTLNRERNTFNERGKVHSSQGENLNDDGNVINSREIIFNSNGVGADEIDAPSNSNGSENTNIISKTTKSFVREQGKLISISTIQQGENGVRLSSNNEHFEYDANGEKYKVTERFYDANEELYLERVFELGTDGSWVILSDSEGNSRNKRFVDTSIAEVVINNGVELLVNAMTSRVFSPMESIVDIYFKSVFDINNEFIPVPISIQKFY